MRGWPAQCGLHPAADPGTADPGDRLAPALRRPRAGQHPPRRHRRLHADRRGTGTLPGCAGGSGADGGVGERAGELQQRHGGDQPLFPPTGGGTGQEPQHSRRGRRPQRLPTGTGHAQRAARWQLCGPRQYQPRHPAGRRSDLALDARQRTALDDRHT